VSRALWRFAVRGHTDGGVALHCPLCEWSTPIKAFGPDELGPMLRVAFGHLEAAHEPSHEGCQ
jgi:hypothetical protein